MGGSRAARSWGNSGDGMDSRGAGKTRGVFGADNGGGEGSSERTAAFGEKEVAKGQPLSEKAIAAMQRDLGGRVSPVNNKATEVEM